ncbi:MAG: rRNA maturation RNase YbeY [Candidatus Taylorbacteria bacterium]|nr:rRNA maturation RNase YbeY [Candidatus Taylorbacteria bacterium]
MSNNLENNFSITWNTKGNSAIAELPFELIKETVLGKEYELSLVFVNRSTIKKLNKEHRKIDKATDILSFPLSKSAGEIFINLEESKKEAIKFDREIENFISFLFIHGLVHLEGFDHGSRMEARETKFRKEFGI